MHGIQTCSAADIAREQDIHWVVHRIVQDQLDYREVCAHWMPKNPTDDKVQCMGLYGPFLYPLDMLHWSKRAVLELKHVKLCKTWNQKNDVWQRNYHLSLAKKNACFGFPWPWWHYLLIVIVVHLAYGSYFCKRSWYFTKVLSLRMKMSGIIHPNGQLFMAVNLIGYGSVPILCSVLSLLLNPGEEPGW